MKPGRRNILFVTPWYPTPAHIYAGIFVREYSQAVQLQDHVTVLHVGHTEPGLPCRWGMQEVTDPQLNSGIPSYRAWYRRSPIRGVSWFRYWAGAIRAAMALSRKHGPFDLIHAHVFSSAAIALLLGRWYGIPVVLSEHATSFARGVLSPARIRQARRVFRRAKAVLPVSHALQRAMEQCGIRAAFRVVPNTVNAELFHFEPRCPAPDGVVRLLTVTSFLPYKGLEVLLRALRQVPWRGRPWRLDMVGGVPGPDMDRHQKIVDDLGLTAQVTFHGTKDKGEVARMMRGADLFVLPSLVETFSVATAESLMSGLPVLVTQCGGPEEFVDEQCGRIVESGDASALADGITKMLDSLKIYDRMEIARIAKMRFGHEAVGAVLMDVYSQVTGLKNTPAETGAEVRAEHHKEP